MTTWPAYGLYIVFALGAAGLYFLLPRSGASKKKTGALLGVSAVIGLFAFLGSRSIPVESGKLYFYLFAALAILAAVRVITHPKPVYSAIYFVAVVIAVAALLVLLKAEFTAIALIIVYAGAILVTYLFVIMLAQQPGSPIYDRQTREPFVAVAVGFVLTATIAGRAGESASTALPGTTVTDFVQSTGSTVSLPAGNTIAVGAAIMTRHVTALEIAGVLLLISMVGAIALSRKRFLTEMPVAPDRALGAVGKEAEPF